MFVNVILLSCCLSLISAEYCLGSEEESLLNDIKSALQTLETRLKDKSLRCSPGWKEYAHHCYNFISTPVTWNEAERACRKIGGYLVKVDDELESNWLKQQANVEERSFWAGAADFSEGDWRWIVDFSNVTFTDWNPGQPDNAGDMKTALRLRRHIIINGMMLYAVQPMGTYVKVKRAEHVSRTQNCFANNYDSRWTDYIVRTNNRLF